MRPVVKARTRILAAALVWCAVGIGLLAVGVRWLALSGAELALPAACGAAAVGWIKARTVLGPRARANAGRLVAEGDDRWLGGMFTWPSWALVLGMAFFGAALRASPMPRFWLGFVDVAVGVGLLAGTRPLWESRRRTT